MIILVEMVELVSLIIIIQHIIVRILAILILRRKLVIIVRITIKSWVLNWVWLIKIVILLWLIWKMCLFRLTQDISERIRTWLVIIMEASGLKVIHGIHIFDQIMLIFTFSLSWITKWISSLIGYLKFFWCLVIIDRIIVIAINRKEFLIDFLRRKKD